MNDQVDVDVRTIREAASQIARWRDALITMLSDEQRQAFLDGTAVHRLWKACEERGLGDASLRIVTGSEVCVDVNPGRIGIPDRARVRRHHRRGRR